MPIGRREETRRYRSKYLEKIAKRQWEYKLRKMYGISSDIYFNMLIKQNNVCKICLKECPVSKKLSVDHNHKTGKVRGLLCQNCNRAIGLLKEDFNNFTRAITYLCSNEDFLTKDFIDPEKELFDLANHPENDDRETKE